MFHSVIFLSIKTTSAEKNYLSYELEVLSIVKTLGRLRIYLLSIPFVIFTDS